MAANNSLKKYAIIFGVLLFIVLFLFVFNTGENERTFKNNLVTIDTSAVSTVLLYPKTEHHREVKLYKSGNDWKINLKSGKSVSVPKEKMKNLFRQLLSIKPNRIAARKKTKWHEYEVDTTGTRIQVLEGNDVTLDIVIGKFSYQPQFRAMNSFVRLENDKDVYEVNGFLSMTFNQGENAYRNAKLISGNTNNWNRLAFDYPADSSFQMVKINNKWISNSKQLDSAKVANYLRQLMRITNSNFVDNPSKDLLNKPVMKLRIDTNDSKVITLQMYGDSKNEIISSSMNTESYFDAKKNKFAGRIFKGLTYFLPTKHKKKK